MSAQLVATSKFLSLVLRHAPGTIGLVLDPNGWADLDDLIRLANARGRRLTRALVDEVVATSEKQRFRISDDGTKIRANQGHSVRVDLELAPVEPPAWLFHGTVARFLGSIRAQGLRPGHRLHVHLSLDEGTARCVGARRGDPVVLRVDALAMFSQGHVFHRSENGVWLTNRVPPQFLRFPA